MCLEKNGKTGLVEYPQTLTRTHPTGVILILEACEEPTLSSYPGNLLHTGTCF